MKAHLDSFFPTPLYVADLDDMADINRDLSLRFNKLAEAHPEGQKGNWGGVANVYASFMVDSQLHRQPFMQRLLERIQPAIQYFCEQVELDTRQRALSIAESWFNISDYGSFQEYHSHAGIGPFCGVYYVEVPENSGNTVFRASFPAMRPYFNSTNPNNPYYRYRKTVLSQAGRFVMFPSWLEHCVTQSQAQGQPRTTIAFNFKH
ncbi:MAG: TIGR02466 family protein [Xanthomonadales bacterium]|jgi:uncharacterized protein (TIGR02466 family)|nr:TIGR02466 family protein [Xanthomonadales bacterium]